MDQPGIPHENGGALTAIGAHSRMQGEGAILQPGGLTQAPDMDSVQQASSTGVVAAQQVLERSVETKHQPDVFDVEIERLRAENPALVGVGGWLKWFCIAIIFFSPLAFLSEALTENDALVWVVGIALSGWHVFTGIMILRRSNRALRYVAILLVAQFCLGGLALIGSVVTSEGPSNSSGAAAGMQALVATFIWYLYFHFSKRVRLTFGRNL